MNRFPLQISQALPAAAVAILLTLSVQASAAGAHPFPPEVAALFGSLPEGFAIGRGSTAFNGSIDGSIYKMDLRSGEGGILVEPEPDFNVETDCYKLGMRVDSRTNYLFVAGCVSGQAYVFDADNGSPVMTYQLPLPEDIANSDDPLQIVNDLTITEDAVYFTDAHQPLLYRLPLGEDGALPPAGAATPIRLVGDFVNILPEEFCCGANGIVSTPDGKTLIIDHSNYTQLFRVDPETGQADLIEVDGPLSGFLDGMAMRNRTLYIMSPGDAGPDEDRVQVVKLDKSLLQGKMLGLLTAPHTDGFASGALFGRSLYVNNAGYFTELVSEKWVNKLDTRAIEPVPE